MKFSFQINIKTEPFNMNKRHTYALMRRIQHLETAIANIDPEKQILEAIEKVTSVSSKKFYDS